MQGFCTLHESLDISRITEFSLPGKAMAAQYTRDEILSADSTELRMCVF